MGRLIKSKSVHCQKGVSLLELLVVLILISVLLGTVSLNYFTNSADQVEPTVINLRQQLTALRDESILQGRLHSVIFSKNEYTFMVLNNDNKLEKLENDSVLRSAELPEGLTFTKFDFEKNSIDDKPGLFVDSSGLLPSFRLAVASDNETWWLTHKPEEGMRVVQQK